MGTRADFYVGRGKDAAWLGSVAWDGDPDSFVDLFGIAEEAKWRAAVGDIIGQREDGTKPGDGWPWPWDDSCTTDWAYAFDNGKVYASHFGARWQLAAEFNPDLESPKSAVFPDMSERKNVTLGKRSGVIVLGR